MAEGEATYRVYHTDTDHWPKLASRAETACRFTQVRWATARKLKPGERLIVYIGKLKSLCGVLEVTGPAYLSDDSTYPVQLPVRPIVAGDAERAVRVDEPETWNILMQGGIAPFGSRGWAGKARLRTDLGRFPPGVGARLLALLEDSASPIDPASVGDTRVWMLRRVKARHGQGAFRLALLDAYKGRCAVSGCEVLEAIEAAHILPHLGRDSQTAPSGLPLRADIHALFDCGLVTVHPVTLLVCVSPSLSGSIYQKFDGRRLRETADPADAPNSKALAIHHAAARAIWQRRAP